MGASRADRHVNDGVAFKPGEHQLIEQDSFQIDERLGIAGLAKVQRGAGYFGAKAAREPDIDFEAAGADRGPQRRFDPMGVCSELFHRVDAGRCDIGDNATPSGMQRANDLRAVVLQQNRYAIGGKNCENPVGRCADHAVRNANHAAGLRINCTNAGSVHLMDLDEFDAGRKAAFQTAPVALHVGGIVACKIGEIQRFIRSAADAAAPAQETAAYARPRPWPDGELVQFPLRGRGFRGPRCLCARRCRKIDRSGRLHRRFVMDGYRFMIERNRLMYKLEDELAKIRHLPDVERRAKTNKLQAEFDRQLAALYREVAEEYPGERRIKARPISDPR